MTAAPEAGAAAGSVVDRVLAELRRGGTSEAIAARAGLPTDLVVGVLRELTAVGLVGPAASAGCSTGPTCAIADLPRADRPVTCAGCPIAR